MHGNLGRIFLKLRALKQGFGVNRKLILLQFVKKNASENGPKCFLKLGDDTMVEAHISELFFDSINSFPRKHTKLICRL